MELTTLWFALIAVLWIGYFILEGFDFGVGILLNVIGRNEPERRAILRTIGPVWDGNEVWVLVAGGATFAAFPEWYATLFSGFYLALFLILVALIIRGIGIEYRNKRGDLPWRTRMDLVIGIGSFLPALLWGVAFANIVQGVPIDAHKEFTGNLITLLNPFGLLGGVTTLLLFITHGLLFLTLKTEGELRERARSLTLPVGLVTAVVAVVFLLWANAIRGDLLSTAVAVVAAVAWLGALGASWIKREARRLRGVRADHRARGREPVPGPVPGRHAVVHGPGLQPHDDERGVHAVHAHDHDGRGRDLRPARPDLPGLDLLRVPQAGDRAAGERRGLTMRPRPHGHP